MCVQALGIAEEMSKVAKRVMVIEDSTHQREVVLENIKAYGKFVTPGSYLLVQDTRGGRWKPAEAVDDFLSMPEVNSSYFTMLFFYMEDITMMIVQPLYLSLSTQNDFGFCFNPPLLLIYLNKGF